MLALKPGVVMQELEGKAVVLDTHSARYFELNETALEMLRQLQAGVSEHDCVAVIAHRYGQPETRVAQDLTTLLHDLRTQALLS